MELEHPGKYIMLTFSGLWSLCDNQGVFLYKPRSIKLDILPFLKFKMEDTLSVLVQNNLIKIFTHESEQYGYIPTFLTHQRLTSKEVQEGRRFPQYIENKETNSGVISGSYQGHSGLVPGSYPNAQEGKGKDKRKGVEEEEGVRGNRETFTAPTLDEVKDYFKKNGYSEDSAIRAFNYYDAGNWIDGNGKKVKVWKQKMISVWFKPENLAQPDKPRKLTTEELAARIEGKTPQP